MSELLIHATHNEHRVVADLLAPRGSWRTEAPMARLVVDAVTALGQEEFAKAAGDNGVPLVVDPMTLPLPHGAHPADSWMQLPYARAEGRTALSLRDPAARWELVSQTVELQIDLGATMLVPAHVYATSPGDPWHLINLALLRDTAQYVAEHHAGMSLLPVLCGQADGFTRVASWRDGVDRFADMAASVGAGTVAVSMSPVGGVASDKYDKTLRYFSTLLHLQQRGVRVIAWHQGVFGAGLIAAGVHGYSTGIGKLETSKAATQARGRLRGRSDDGDGGSYKGLYLDAFGHSVPFHAGERLLHHEVLRPQLMCADDEGCCASWSETLEHPREHAVRARARQRALLDGQPRSTWRLTQLVREAESAVNVAKQANQVLEAAGEKFRVKLVQLESLRDVAEHLRQVAIGAATA
ncbi:MAG TPA: hypothetical protein VNU01_04305 [Egibacteraceae bacterium]|nr:hypothetical protein [Egibacteraceae bacterium]